MTIIEFYDSVPIHNILGALQFRPERLIYVGGIPERQFQNEKLPALKAYFKKKLLSDMDISYIQVNRTDLQDILDKLENVYRQNTDCKFHVEVTGGDDLALVAVGILSERHHEINLFQISGSLQNIQSYCLDVPGLTQKFSVDFYNSTEDNLILHGASIVSDNGEDNKFYSFRHEQLTDSFLERLNFLWHICCHGVNKGSCDNGGGLSYPAMWNRLTSALAEMYAIGQENNGNLIFLTREKYVKTVNRHIGLSAANQYLTAMMNKNILRFDTNKSFVKIEFESSQLRECLLKSGNVLELKTYSICRELLNEYSGDVRTGVIADWDSKAAEEGNLSDTASANTANEIDVLATCGLVPYFISCKNGKFDSDELYKLQTVAERFGTRYAHKIIVATDISFAMNGKECMLLQRASDMGIHMIYNVHTMSDDKWKSEMKKAMRLPKPKTKVKV